MINEDIRVRVQGMGNARLRTLHWLMREAITQCVELEEKLDMFRQDTLMAGG